MEVNSNINKCIQTGSLKISTFNKLLNVGPDNLVIQFKISIQRDLKNLNHTKTNFHLN